MKTWRPVEYWPGTQYVKYGKGYTFAIEARVTDAILAEHAGDDGERNENYHDPMINGYQDNK